jgi:hypothetical protein
MTAKITTPATPLDKKLRRAIQSIRNLAIQHRQRAEADAMLRRHWLDSADAWDKRADLFESLAFPAEHANDNTLPLRKAG